MHSYIAFILGAGLATAVRGSANYAGDHPVLPRHITCMPSNAGGCASCGSNYAQCGPDTCYNPSAGEVCCSNQYPCPASTNCSSAGTGCDTTHGSHRDADCDDDDKGYGTSVNIVSTSSTTAAEIVASSSVSTTTDSTTSFTTTITSTTTSTVTVSMTSSSADACAFNAATTGLPMTTSMAPFGNSTTVALNTTTSTLSVTNVSTTTPPSVSVPINATVPTRSIVPPINGYTGAATDLHGHSPTSLFALGSLVFVAALLV